MSENPYHAAEEQNPTQWHLLGVAAQSGQWGNKDGVGLGVLEDELYVASEKMWSRK